MGFKIVSQTFSQIEDRDPNLYVKRAEDFFKKNQHTAALAELEIAINYAENNNKIHYIIQKVKTYQALGTESSCVDFIKNNLIILYNNLSTSEFNDVLRLLKINLKTYGFYESIESILIENGLPSVLSERKSSSRSRRLNGSELMEGDTVQMKFGNTVKIIKINPNGLFKGVDIYSGRETTLYASHKDFFILQNGKYIHEGLIPYKLQITEAINLNAKGDNESIESIHLKNNLPSVLSERKPSRRSRRLNGSELMEGDTVQMKFGNTVKIIKINPNGLFKGVDIYSGRETTLYASHKDFFILQNGKYIHEDWINNG